MDKKRETEGGAEKVMKKSKKVLISSFMLNRTSNLT